MLEVKNVFTQFGKMKMLQDVSLEIKQGEIVCLLGSNGAGKSTTIKTILSLINPVKGTVHFNGDRIDVLKTYQIINLGLSIVPEGRRLFPKMSVLENLKIALKVDVPEERQKGLLERVFTLFPVLAERRTQPAGTLSGGEQAMLAIGRALVQEPELLILDEPSFGLAPILVEKFYETIESIRKQGTTILLTEQNAGKALAIADRGYVLQKGAIFASGTTDELCRNDLVRECYLG
jgi:branched-chain amino acid transport system ATP-binding protein